MEEVKRRAACAGIVLMAASSTMLAKDPNAKTFYCTQEMDGKWGLHQFKPLIRVQGGTVYAEMVLDGAVLGEMRLRRFEPDSMLEFDYTFDASGRLTELKGSVTVKSVPPPGAVVTPGFELADWLGEAELTPGSDGRIPAHHVLYSREKDRIDKPENAEKYVDQFNGAPVYGTVQSVPCAAMLKEAERMNATQE